MAFYDKFPYTNFQELNLDWIIKTTKSALEYMETWFPTHEFKYADPIQWDGSRTYEVYTIVLAPTGDSYLSKTAVPPGVSYTNTDYWQQLDTKSAQVEALEQRMDAVEDETADLRTDLTTEAGKTTVLQNKVANLENLAKPSDMTKVLFIGDSYAVRPNNWITGLVSRLGLTVSDYYVQAEGSSGFGRAGSSGNKWYQLLQIWQANHTESERNAISHIIVAGGSNDVLVIDDVNSGIESFESVRSTYFSNAKVILGFIGYEFGLSDYYRNYGDCISKYIMYAKEYGWQYLTGCEYVMHNIDYMETDNVHPTAAGCDILSEAMHTALMRGCTTVKYPIKVIAQTDARGAGYPARNVYANLFDNMASVFINAFFVTTAITAVSANYGTKYDLLTLDKAYINGSEFETTGTLVTATIVHGGVLTEASAFIYVYQNKLKVQFYNLAANISDVTFILFSPLKILAITNEN